MSNTSSHKPAALCMHPWRADLLGQPATVTLFDLVAYGLPADAHNPWTASYFGQNLAEADIELQPC